MFGGGKNARHRMSTAPSEDELAALTGAAPVISDDDAEPVIIKVWRPNWLVVQLLQSALNSNCIRLPPMGGQMLGLDWVQVRVLADGYGLPWDRSTIESLKIGEDIARQALAAKAPKK